MFWLTWQLAGVLIAVCVLALAFFILRKVYDLLSSGRRFLGYTFANWAVGLSGLIGVIFILLFWK